MTIAEAGFLAKEKKGTTVARPEGTLVVKVTQEAVKVKWSGLVASSCHPSDFRHLVPPFAPEYVALAKKYPDAGRITKRYQNVPIVCLVLSARQLSEFYWVQSGTVERPVFNAMAGVWSNQLYARYRQANLDNAVSDFYDSDIVSIPGLRSDLGKDERGDVDLIDTFMWGPGEKRFLFITQVDDPTNDVETLIPYEDRLDFETVKAAGDVSDATLSEIRDVSKVVPPRRNKKVKKTALVKVPKAVVI